MKQRDQRKAKRTKAPEPHKRLLHFSDGEIWSWRFGGAVIKVREPDLTTNHEVHLTEITGMTFDDMERGQWKGWWKGVGPQEIKDYIERHLRPDPAIRLPAQVYVHPYARKGSRWHMFHECRLLPNQRHRAVAPQPISITKVEARIGAPPTRRNLCGMCMDTFDRAQKEKLCG